MSRDGTSGSSDQLTDPPQVEVQCSLVYMDFEGRSDGRSIKSILSHVLVHGSVEATEHLKQHCLKHVCPHVYAHQIEETIDVTSDFCAYKVQLSEKLMSNVLFKKLGDYEIAWIDSEIEEIESGTLSETPPFNNISSSQIGTCQ
ncbi:putative zn-dependent metallo-hydrolase, RNA specificity domain-containing protein [Helianthus debilis subsp. tardiflorus]